MGGKRRRKRGAALSGGPLPFPLINKAECDMRPALLFRARVALVIGYGFTGVFHQAAAMSFVRPAIFA